MAQVLEICEIEYSCSPGGVDKWEVSGENFFAGDFNTAEDAISHVLMLFGDQELKLNVKSLAWYHMQEDND
jgi:hypothetical protein